MGETEGAEEEELAPSSPSGVSSPWPAVSASAPSSGSLLSSCFSFSSEGSSDTETRVEVGWIPSNSTTFFRSYVGGGGGGGG